MNHLFMSGMDLGDILSSSVPLPPQGDFQFEGHTTMSGFSGSAQFSNPNSGGDIPSSPGGEFFRFLPPPETSPTKPSGGALLDFSFEQEGQENPHPPKESMEQAPSAPDVDAVADETSALIVADALKTKEEDESNAWGDFSLE